MPTVTNPNLTLNTVNNDVTITVTFTATFSEFETRMPAAGISFHEHIDVVGIDPPGSTTGTKIAGTAGLFPTQVFPVLPMPMGGPQVIPRSVSQTISRATLQEDGLSGDADEIRCKIRIHAVGLPAEYTPEVWTPQQVLLG